MPVTLEKKDTFEIKRASWESIAGTQFYNPPQALFVNGMQRCFLMLGSNDQCNITVDKQYAYIVCENSGLSYAGLEVIDLSDYTQAFEVFARSEDYDNDGVADMGWDQMLEHFMQWWQD